MRSRARGFTLVELLVALVVMALLAVLSWRGLDGLVRAQESTSTRADEVQALQVGRAQWTADLDALSQVPQMSAIEWNGRVLRLTRRTSGAQAEGLVVVGWARRTVGGASRWSRWQSPPLTTRGQVEEAWQRADAWAQNQAGEAGANEVQITGLVDWQVFYYRADAWTNPLSSDTTQAGAVPQQPPAPPGAGTAAAPPPPAATPPGGRPRAAQVPDGVRIVLTLAPGQAISGDLTRDWVRPTVGGGKS